MSAGVDFASALLHPDTDRSPWGAADLASLSQRQSWPRRHDFELGRSQPVTAKLFSMAEERIYETARVVAARMILLHGARAVEVIGLDLFEAALCGQALLSGSVVNAIVDLAGDGWRAPIALAALGPGNTRLKLDEAAFAKARELLDDYVSAIFDDASQVYRASADPLDELLEFTRTHGRVPVGDERPDLHLWCAEQRRRFRGGLMDAEEAERLAKLPGWTWYFPGGNNQEHGLLRVREFADMCAARGTCLVPFGTRLADGVDIAGWLRDRRRQHVQGKMAPAVSRLLEALPDWTWDHDFWEEGVALRELQSISDACGSVEGCLTGKGLSRPTVALVRAWRRGINPARGPDVLEALPGWTWQVESEARETVRYALLALHLSRAFLTPVQLDISTNRLLAAAPGRLQSSGNRHNLSREAVRQEEGKILSKANHPVVASVVRRDLRAIGYSEAVLTEAVSSRARAAAIAGLRQACFPDSRYVESVLSAVLGRPLQAGCLTPQPARRSRPSAVSGIGVLKGSAAANRTLSRHGVETLADLACVDIAGVRSWRYIRHSTVPEIERMVVAARALLAVDEPGLQIPAQVNPQSGSLGRVPPHSISALQPSVRAMNLLCRNGVFELSELAALDLESASIWTGVGPKVSAEFAELKDAARHVLADDKNHMDKTRPDISPHS